MAILSGDAVSEILSKYVVSTIAFSRYRRYYPCLLRERALFDAVSDVS